MSSKKYHRMPERSTSGESLIMVNRMVTASSSSPSNARFSANTTGGTASVESGKLCLYVRIYHVAMETANRYTPHQSPT